MDSNTNGTDIEQTEERASPWAFKAEIWMYSKVWDYDFRPYSVANKVPDTDGTGYLLTEDVVFPLINSPVLGYFWYLYSE